MISTADRKFLPTLSETTHGGITHAKIAARDVGVTPEVEPMKEPGLDNRHRDKNPPKAGEIQQKRSDTLNKNLPKPIPEFRSDATLGTMRRETGKTSVEAVRRAAKRRG